MEVGGGEGGGRRGRGRVGARPVAAMLLPFAGGRGGEPGDAGGDGRRREGRRGGEGGEGLGEGKGRGLGARLAALPKPLQGVKERVMSSVNVFDNLKKTAYGTATGLVLALSAGGIVRVAHGSFAEKGRERARERRARQGRLTEARLRTTGPLRDTLNELLRLVEPMLRDPQSFRADRSDKEEIFVLELSFHLCCLFYWMQEFRDATKCEDIRVEDTFQFSMEAGLKRIRAAFIRKGRELEAYSPEDRFATAALYALARARAERERAGRASGTPGFAPHGLATNGSTPVGTPGKNAWRARRHTLPTTTTGRINESDDEGAQDGPKDSGSGVIAGIIDEVIDGVVEEAASGLFLRRWEAKNLQHKAVRMPRQALPRQIGYMRNPSSASLAAGQIDRIFVADAGEPPLPVPAESVAPAAAVTDAAAAWPVQRYPMRVIMAEQRAIGEVMQSTVAGLDHRASGQDAHAAGPRFVTFAEYAYRERDAFSTANGGGGGHVPVPRAGTDAHGTSLSTQSTPFGEALAGGGGERHSSAQAHFAEGATGGHAPHGVLGGAEQVQRAAGQQQHEHNKGQQQPSLWGLYILPLEAEVRRLVRLQLSDVRRLSRSQSRELHAFRLRLLRVSTELRALEEKLANPAGSKWWRREGKRLMKKQKSEERKEARRAKLEAKETLVAKALRKAASLAPSKHGEGAARRSRARERWRRGKDKALLYARGQLVLPKPPVWGKVVRMLGLFVVTTVGVSRTLERRRRKAISDSSVTEAPPIALTPSTGPSKTSFEFEWQPVKVMALLKKPLSDSLSAVVGKAFAALRERPPEEVAAAVPADVEGATPRDFLAVEDSSSIDSVAGEGPSSSVDSVAVDNQSSGDNLDSGNAGQADSEDGGARNGDGAPTD